MSHHHNPLPDTPLSEFSHMQLLKRRFFAMRNGALAAQIRAAGLDYRINFGLNLPQIKEIAGDILAEGMPSAQLMDFAQQLWDNEATRESRLIAPMIYPADIMPRQLALTWLQQAQNTEIADHLCHSLIRRLPFAAELAEELYHSPDATDQHRYTALRLWLNLLILSALPHEGIAKVREAGEQSLQTPLTRSVARQLLDELSFLEN